jgi:hypothetical protein
MISLIEYIQEALVGKNTKVLKSANIEPNKSGKCNFTNDELQDISEILSELFDIHLTEQGNLKFTFNDSAVHTNTKTYMSMSMSGQDMMGRSRENIQYYARVFREGSDRMQKLGLYDTPQEAARRIKTYTENYIKKVAIKIARYLEQQKKIEQSIERISNISNRIDQNMEERNKLAFDKQVESKLFDKIGASLEDKRLQVETMGLEAQRGLEDLLGRSR